MGCGTAAPASDDAGADATVPPGSDGGGVDAPFADATVDAFVPDGAHDSASVLRDAPADGPNAANDPCQLPGAVQFTAAGPVTVPGGSSSWPSLSFLHLPNGFCAHYFGTVGNARQLRFAPGGELFVASPTQATTGGGPNGLAAIVALPDDNLDGVADAPSTFLSGLPATQGLLFANGYFYYQNNVKIMRLPYATGQRVASGTPDQVADIAVYISTLHWPKTLDIADDGTIYVGNGGDQTEACDPAHPFHGGILQIDPAPGADPGGIQVAKGLRNPITVRCAPGHDRCFALELAKDFTGGDGGVGREKLIPIHAGDDWGFPCCATQGTPYAGTPAGTDCSGVVAETNGFVIGDTPFGLDFEEGHWPAPWTGQAIVATHGSSGVWFGARIVAIPMDSTSGLPQQSSDTGGANAGMTDFATGWDDGTLSHGRPASVVFSTDGRLFVANDNNGVIFWIAPM